MSRANSVQDFLNHRTMEKGGGFLKNWKEKGSLEHFMHTKHVPTAVWSHPWATIVPLENKDTRETVKRVFPKTYICPESEELLKNQHFRSPDTGERRYPPTKCGVCKLLEWVYQQILLGKLPIEKAIFRVAGDIEKEAVTVHAAGFCGQLKADKLSTGAKERLHKAGVSTDWKLASRESSICKAGYVAVVVDNAAPSEGAQITTIPPSLGDKLKDAIGDEMARMKKAGKDPSLRDPFTHPYMFEWIYDEKESEPNKKYKVRAHPEIQPSEAILEIITGEALNLDREFAPMNQATLRMKLERACLLEGKEAPPWDLLFPVPTREVSDAVADDMVDDPDLDFPPQEKRVLEVGSVVSSKPAPAPEELVKGIPEDELYECVVCGKGSPTPDECVWCGTKYDEQGNPIKKVEPELAPPPKQMRTRNAAPKAPSDKPKQFKPGF